MPTDLKLETHEISSTFSTSATASGSDYQHMNTSATAKAVCKEKYDANTMTRPIDATNVCYNPEQWAKGAYNFLKEMTHTQTSASLLVSLQNLAIFYLDPIMSSPTVVMLDHCFVRFQLDVAMMRFTDNDLYQVKLQLESEGRRAADTLEMLLPRLIRDGEPDYVINACEAMYKTLQHLHDSQFKHEKHISERPVLNAKKEIVGKPGDMTNDEHTFYEHFVQNIKDANNGLNKKNHVK